MRLARALALALALAATGSAQAGSAEDPELTDPAGDAPSGTAGYADVTAAWFETPINGTLRVTIQLATIDEQKPPSATYVAVFDANGTTWYVELITLPGADLGGYGVWDRESGQPAELRGEGYATWTAGTPGIVKISMPADELGTTIEGLDAGSYQIVPRAILGQPVFVPLDTATGGRGYDIPANETAAVEESRDTPWPLATSLALVLLAAVATRARMRA